jgi:signal transduction histidine kinase/ActR/RegA family two-component response regulator
MDDSTITTADSLVRPGRSHLRGVAAVLLVEALILAAVAYGLWVLRQQSLDGELRRLGSLAAAMATQADAGLDVAEATLRATGTEFAQGLLQTDTPAAEALLRTRMAALPQFRALTVADAAGQVIASSLPGPMPPRSLAERDYFRAAQDSTAPRLFVGSPFRSRRDGRPVIGVSMGWHAADGSFQGTVALLADPEFLDGGFRRIAPSADTSLAIYRSDRVLVSDGPGDGSAQLLPTAVTDGLWDAPAPRRVRLPDGHERLVAAQQLRGHPLMVVVSRDLQPALVDWTEQAWLVVAFAASALTVTLFLLGRNVREQRLRLAAQETLAAEQQRAVRAFQAAQEGNWEWDARSGRVDLSPRMKELLGLPRDAPVPPDPMALLRERAHPRDLRALRHALAAHARGRRPLFDATVRVGLADGQWRHVHLRGNAWRDAAGAPLLFSGMAADVSEEVEGREREGALQDQLQRARRLEAIGTLAGGVAHDFNNILASVIGYGELARAAAGDGSDQARQLDQVLQAGQRGKALVERVLSFSRGTPHVAQRFALQPVVEEVLQLMAASLPAGVTLAPQLQAPAAVLAGDPTLVYEAVLNLCTNGVQAMPAGGALHVLLEVEQVDTPRALFEARLAPGRYARLRVQDSGTGIAPEAMDRLFEPFYTTKGPRKGTGLGLAVVHGVVAELGGAIDVQSWPGEGACFTLYFPCLDVPPDAPAPVADAALPLGQGQAVLVVDDEPALVALAEEMLAGLGYEAFGLASSAEALARFTAAPDRFDLVLTDERMPELAGTELAAALHRIRPALPVVLASGYGGPELAQRAAAAGVRVLVVKPLARAELARAVARALQAGLQT